MKSKSYPIIATIVCSILFLFGVGCRPAHTNIDKQSENMIEIAPTGDAELDSLLFVAAHAPADTNLIMLYNDIAQIYESQDFEKAKEYYLKVRNLSEQLNWHRGYNWYAIGFSMLLGREGLSDSAIVILKRAHELATEEKNERAMAVLTINIATIYKGKIWHETALEHYMQALSYFEPLNDTRMLIHIYYMLCDLYSSMNMVDKAIEYGEKAYALSPENPSVIGVLAGAYSNDYQYDKANSYLEKALQICELQHNTFVKGLVYGQLGRNIVSISDTGVGIPAEQIENLLRLDRKRGRGVARNAPTRGTANESGTGLGLIICKELLEKHGTTLHIESEAGKGSRFWFELMGV